MKTQPCTPLVLMCIGLMAVLSGCRFPLLPEAGTSPAAEDLPVLAGAVAESLLAACPAGGTVILPRGRYLLRRSLVLDRPITLQGEPGTVLELLPGASTSLVEIRPRSGLDRIEDVRVTDLELAGRRSEQAGGDGILILRAARCEIRRVRISNAWGDGVYCSAVEQSLFEDLTLRGCGRNGFSLGEAVPEPVSRGNTLRRCVARGNLLMGIDLEPAQDCELSQCRATGNESYGISVGAGSRSRGNRLLACIAEVNGETGINLWSDANTVVSCVASGNGGDGISVIGPAATGNVLLHCSTKSNGRHGVGLDRTTGTLVSGCDSRDNGTSGLGDGIALVAGTPVFDNRFVDNQVTGTSHRYALVITEKALRTVCRGNQFTGRLSVTAPDVSWE